VPVRTRFHLFHTLFFGERDMDQQNIKSSRADGFFISPTAVSSASRYLARLIPGLCLSAAVAGTATAVRYIPGAAAISSMVVAFVLGMVISGFLGNAPITAAGTRVAAKSILRFGVALLGFQLTLHQLGELGGRALLVVVAALILTFVFTKWIGRLFGVDRALSELIAAGTSVCGASAVIATNAVTNAPDQDVGYAVACVSLFGTLAMIVYPLLFAALHLDVRTYGLWTGASIHEVAQVVAAAFQADPAAGQIAVPIKLARVALLAPLVIALGSFRFRREGQTAAMQFEWQRIFPPFLIAFVLLVLFNSAVSLSDVWRGWIGPVTTFLLSMSLAAIGLETSIRHLRHKGLRPLLLTGTASLFISALSLLLIEVFV
jgi:uncharacterized integral membrane protein (TIGR00698 family)